MTRVEPRLLVPILAGSLLLSGGAAYGDWVTFVDETSKRLQAASSVGAGDGEEKDYAWADLNQNGWVDLVVMRKQPWTTTGRERNVLFMNEEGVLVDRSEQYASAAIVDGHTDQGFLTETNDRMAAIADVDNDGWKDVVTATTLSFGQPKHIAYPRVYMNLGNDGSGNWQGLRFEDDRIPQFEGNASNGNPYAPRFCAIDAGDVTGDGWVDLYFGDYDSGFDGSSFDFQDRLLVNQGEGYFEDESWRIPVSWRATVFATAIVIDDFNDNGVNDIIRVNSLSGSLPYAVHKMYNNPDNIGHFSGSSNFVSVVGGSPYFARAADLNNNGRLDLVVSRDGSDRRLINQGNDSSGQVVWSGTNLPNSNGFRSNITIVDLNNNGWKDILVADVDVDISGCNRTADFHRNNQNPPNVTFAHDSGNIPSSMLQGTFDIAAFDITGNGWNDLVVGRCTGTQVWINQPQFGIDFVYPDGQPTRLDTEEATTLIVEMDAFGASLETDESLLYYAVDGGKFTSVPLVHLGDNVFEAQLPAADCLSTVEYYFSGTLDNGQVINDPIQAPTVAYSAVAVVDTVIALSDDIGPPGPMDGWEVISDDSLTGGEWEAAVPNPTFLGGNLASPDGDASDDPNGMAWTTENCEAGQFPGECNVQHGPTDLISPVFDLEGTDGEVSYDRWLFCSDAGTVRADFLRTYISNDGGDTWVFIHETEGTDSEWESVSFLVSQYVVPTDNLRVKFSIEDENNFSITNAGIDNFTVEEFVCDDVTPCLGDLTGDGNVGVPDLLAMINQWGACPGSGDCPADLTGNGSVGVPDLLVLINNWGSCD